MQSQRAYSSLLGALGKRIAPFFCFVLLTGALMLIEFGDGLHSYFTSDDLYHITYAYQMLHDGGRLLSMQFSTVWMQDTSLEIFYRPLIEVSIMLDLMCSGTNPFGYHLSNLLFSFLGAIALAFVGASLSKLFEFENQWRIGFVAGLLFAVSPLHPEVTTWIIGRVDGLSTMFYLIAFAAFLEMQDVQKRGRIAFCVLSLLSFSLALLCKEMAATLPLVIFACILFLSKKKTLWEKMRESLFSSSQYFGVLLIYLVVRYCATGSLIGGYLGVPDALDVSKIMFRLSHLSKIFFPLNSELVSLDNLGVFFAVFYAACAVYLLQKLYIEPFSAKSIKLFSFLLVWMILQLLPVFLIFFIDDSLGGARLFYLGSAVLSIVSALILIPERFNPHKMTLHHKLAAALLCSLVILSVYTGYLNDQCWMVAGVEAHELQQQIKDAVSKLPDGKELVLAYVPNQVLGAHFVIHSRHIRSLLSPPLLRDSLSNKVSMLEQKNYTHSFLIPSGTLKRKLADVRHYQIVYWDTFQQKLKTLPSNSNSHELAKSDLPALKAVADKQSGATLLLAAVPFKTRLVRFIELDLETLHMSPSEESHEIRLQFDEFDSLPRELSRECKSQYDPHLKRQTVRIPVDELLAWFLKGELSSLKVITENKDEVQISAARLSDGKTIIPVLTPRADTLKESRDGVFSAVRFPLEFEYDATALAGAVNCTCELSRPRVMMQLDDLTYHAKRPSKKPLKTWVQPTLKGSFKIDRDVFPEYANYQLRIFAQKADGSFCGTSSDLIDLGINDMPENGKIVNRRCASGGPNPAYKRRVEPAR